MTSYGMWSPYVGIGAVTLAVFLLVIAAIFAFLGFRLHRPIGAQEPGRAVGAFLIVMWILAILVFIFASAAYQLAIYQQAGKTSTPFNPITPVTLFSALVTFIIILLISRRQGWKAALGSAIVGAAAGLMIFELPFDLIIMWRLPEPAPPNLYRYLTFLPLFVVEIATFSLLTLSPRVRISKYSLYFLSAMFLVWTVWAWFGFSYPSDPLPTALNAISKVLSFATAITLFLPIKDSREKT
jgi:hypothetical protein